MRTQVLYSEEQGSIPCMSITYLPCVEKESDLCTSFIGFYILHSEVDDIGSSRATRLD